MATEIYSVRVEWTWKESGMSKGLSGEWHKRGKAYHAKTMDALGSLYGERKVEQSGNVCEGRSCHGEPVVKPGLILEGNLEADNGISKEG